MPIPAWVAAVGLVAALVATFIFKVAVGTVLTHGLIGLMVFSHLFIHGGRGCHTGHGGHAGNEQRTGAAANAVGLADAARSIDKHASHAGGGR